MTTEQIDVPIEALQTNPGPLSDIEDGEIPNLENHSSPTLNKKAKKKSKSKKLSAKRKELENIDFNSSTSEQINSDHDSDDGWWSKKKRHLNDLKATRYHEEVEGEDIIIEESSNSYSSGKFDKNFQRRDSFSKEKSYQGKNSKFKDEKESGDSADENNKDAQRYPCKAYIAYGKCTDPDCRCVHAPLTRESEIKRFIDENEEYFHEVFKKFPGIALPPPLLKALSDKFGPPPSPPVANPANTSSPQGHVLRPMPPPKFFPPQNHFPGPVSPTPTPPVFGFPPQQPNHQFPNMFPPGGVHPPQASPQGFPVQPMPQMAPSMFPGQQTMQPMQPIQSMFNGMNGMSLVASPIKHGFGMMNNMNNMSPVRSPMGLPQMPYGMYPGNMGVGFPGANMNMNTNMMNSSNFEAKQIDIKIKSPEKRSPSRNKDSKHKSPEGTNSSKSSPSSTAKEISEELAKLSKRKSTEKMPGNTSIEKNTSSSSADIQSMETDSTTPENKSKEELKRAKNDSTAEKIARLVELFKAKKQKTTDVTLNKESEENIQPQESLIKQKDDAVVTAVPVVVNQIPKQEPKVLDIRKEPENGDELKENKVNKMEEEKPVVEPVKEVEKPVEIEKKEESVKKSIFENVSTNELLLRQLKSALPLNQLQSAGNIKDLVNMYLKLGKNPGF